MCELCDNIDVYTGKDIYLETKLNQRVHLVMEWEGKCIYGNPETEECYMQINFCPECGKDLRNNLK